MMFVITINNTHEQLLAISKWNDVDIKRVEKSRHGKVVMCRNATDAAARRLRRLSYYEWTGLLGA